MFTDSSAVVLWPGNRTSHGYQSVSGIVLEKLQ